MMVNRRCSFFVTGALLSALVLFGAEAAFAQEETDSVDDLAASPRSHDTIRLTWTHDNDGLDKFTLRYQQNTPENSGNADPIVVALTDFDTDKSITRMDIKKNASSEEYTYTLDGLKPDMDYIFAIRALGADATPDAPLEDLAHAKTDTADAPDDLMGLEVMAGDGMIMAMWDEATDNGSEVTGYEVQYKMSDEADSKYKVSRDGDMESTSTEWTISNVENDEDYTVRVRACSFGECGDWSDEEEVTPMEGTPTPALPLFGAFALGAGLLAAGRARLRRREQHQLTR